MPHADASLVPSTIITKSRFWEHVYSQLESLLEGQRHWVTNLANASSLIYNCLVAFPAYFGSGDHAVNWCGFYILPSLFPLPRFTTLPSSQASVSQVKGSLLLGPFCGKPACQLINLQADKARGVCADAFIHGKTVLVQDVNTYPGHIACDGSTHSEIVCPLIYQSQGSDEPLVVGVLDLDCLALSGFDEDDQAGLEKIAELIVQSCDW
ncbi:GAF domain-like protein [Pisolithus marmoratus]|nr:GAF domain-like protein [Pisolithus marmoratus]